MVRRHIALALTMLTATAAEGAATTSAFDKQPPGHIVQDVTAYLSGEAMNSAWHVVTSRTLAGKQMGETPVYQWYLSFYAPSQNGLKLAYRLPNKSTLLIPNVTKAHGAQMYFPHEQLTIVGTGELERSGVQDVVVQSHAFAADCGIATIAVFGAKSAGTTFTVEPRVTVNNACSLNASIVKNGALQNVRLSGPYYAKSAPLCCPTKPNAAAMLTFSAGTWSVKPDYFIISASLASHY